MMSHILKFSSAIFNASLSSRFTFASSLCAFSRAMISASEEMSHAVTLEFQRSRANVIAMHPLPVPMSNTFIGSGG